MCRMAKLKIYTTSWCPDCFAAKRVLGKKGVEYDEINIDEDPSAVKTVVAARGKKVVPTLEYNGKYIDGNHFNAKKFENELEELLA